MPDGERPLIQVIDEIVARPGEGKALLDDYLARYAPGARARGMVLEQILVSPPVWLDDQSNTLSFRWSLADAAAWWGCARSVAVIPRSLPGGSRPTPVRSAADVSSRPIPPISRNSAMYKLTRLVTLAEAADRRSPNCAHWLRRTGPCMRSSRPRWRGAGSVAT
ncbi:MAG: hypothetical protein ACO1O3_12990 [Sphingobium sp.]